MNIQPCKIADSVSFNTFKLLLAECNRYLGDVHHLKPEPALMKLFGFKFMPDAHTLSNWLCPREGSQRSDQAFDAVRQQRLKATLNGFQKLSQDIDATSIESRNCKAKLTYRKRLYINTISQAEWIDEHPTTH